LTSLKELAFKLNSLKGGLAAHLFSDSLALEKICIDWIDGDAFADLVNVPDVKI
jgi:hypothetical protein